MRVDANTDPFQALVMRTIEGPNPTERIGRLLQGAKMIVEEESKTPSMLTPDQAYSPDLDVLLANGPNDAWRGY